MNDLENGVVAGAAARNWGYGWEEHNPICERCGKEIRGRTEYGGYYGYILCEDCFYESMDDEY